MSIDFVLIGKGRRLISIPRSQWELELSKVPAHFEKKLGFMTSEHHEVRNFVVRTLPTVGAPLGLDYIADKVHLSVDRVESILNDLERNLTFLYRDPQGNVAWAYPVTVDPTPHAVSFSSGERLYAA